VPIITNLSLGGGITVANTFSTPVNVSSTISIPDDKDRLVYVTGNASRSSGNSPAGADTSWRSICWSPERRLFVAVGRSEDTGAARCATSPDGITWTARSPQSGSWWSVCWSPERGLFVAVAGTGTTQRVMTSPDGITWTARTTPGTNEWYSVCWSPERGLFVAVAASGTNGVMTSPDGITWTAGTSPSESWRSVCWSPERGLFVAVAPGLLSNTVMTSPDGITWTARAPAVGNEWNCVCWSPERGLFVAVAKIGGASPQRAMTSPDGINWTARTTPASRYFDSVCWSPERGLFIAVGEFNHLMTSSDGITWTLRSLIITSGYAIVWSSQLGRFVSSGFSTTFDLINLAQFNASPIQNGQKEGQRLILVGTDNYNAPELRSIGNIDAIKNSNDPVFAIASQDQYELRWDSVNSKWVRRGDV
jgi:hypothetical protein